MGAKQKGGASKSRGNATEEVEETLQAVVCNIVGRYMATAISLLVSSSRTAHLIEYSEDANTLSWNRFLRILSRRDLSPSPLINLVYGNP